MGVLTSRAIAPGGCRGPDDAEDLDWRRHSTGRLAFARATHERLLAHQQRPVFLARRRSGRGEAVAGKAWDQHVPAMPGRVDPLLDDAGRFLAAIGDVLGASAARAAVRHEAVVIEAVAPRHVRSVLAGQRSEGAIRAQLTKPMRCAKAVERGRGFRRAGNGQRAAASHRRSEQRARNMEKLHRHPVLPLIRAERKRRR